MQEMWSWTRWLIDRFHGGNSHNMNRESRSAQVAFCKKCCDVTKMDKQRNYPKGIDKANSETQEQIMNIIGKFQWTFNMHPDIQWFFLYWMCFDLNELRLQDMVRNNVRVSPGPSGYI